MLMAMRRGVRNDKRVNQRIHAKKRALERYDLELTRTDMEAMVKQIMDNEVDTFYRSSTNRNTLHKVTWEGRTLIVVYDKDRKTIVTFLPEDAEAR